MDQQNDSQSSGLFPWTASVTTRKMATAAETGCFESQDFVRFQYYVDNILLALSTVASLLNIVVVCCALKLLRRNGDTVHLFIVSMTLGDCLLTGFCHPIDLLSRKQLVLKQVTLLCRIVHFNNWLGLAVSGLSLTMLNIDKLIYFQFPLSYDRAMSKNKAVAICLLLWFASISYVFSVHAFDVVRVSGDCTLQLNPAIKVPFYELFMFFFCVLPVTSSLLVSIYLFRLTRQKRHAISSVHTTTFTRKLRSMVFIFATTVWTSLSLLPYRVFNLGRIYLFDFRLLSCAEKHSANWLAWILLYLIMLNPIVNPMITALIYAPYRLLIKKMLLRHPLSRRLGLAGARGRPALLSTDQTNISSLSTTVKSRHNNNNNNNNSGSHEMTSLISAAKNRKMSAAAKL